ncbi:MAG TPA: hypothetical protein EYO32_11415 [Rhodospirillales bacterium]|nr:hypothetical protein [Rhodospirillales bacterium]
MQPCYSFLNHRLIAEIYGTQSNGEEFTGIGIRVDFTGLPFLSFNDIACLHVSEGTHRASVIRVLSQNILGLGYPLPGVGIISQL